MTEEEYFRKNYPNSCYGDKPLSPYWDYFQEGVEFGERESENKIEELEQKLEQTEKDLADYQFNYPTIKELQKENEELKKTYRKQRNKRIDELQKENSELKAFKEKCKFNVSDLCKDIENEKQLTKAKELLKWALHSDPEHDEDFEKKWDEAEQFLNSEVEK